MNETIIYLPYNTPALNQAANRLRSCGIRITDVPTLETTHLLLPVPCRKDISELLSRVPPTVTVIGGNLAIPNSIDLLQDEHYLAQNAKITAHVAMTIAAQHLPITYDQTSVLILGWGRIGKCLSRLLSNVGADVTVAARNPKDQSMAEAMGYRSTDIQTLNHILRRFRVIFNTVAYPVLDLEQLTYCRPDCVKIELASQPGIAGEVIEARGLPGRYAPESSGRLIAQTILRLLAREEAVQ